MAAWQSFCSRAVLLPGWAPGCSTRNSTSRSGPPPGAGTPTAAASITSDMRSTHALSISTELTCSDQAYIIAVAGTSLPYTLKHTGYHTNVFVLKPYLCFSGVRP